MRCPNCERTADQHGFVDDTPKYFWCGDCGTIIWTTETGFDHATPKLVEAVKAADDHTINAVRGAKALDSSRLADVRRCIGRDK